MPEVDFPSPIALPEEKANIIISDNLTFWKLNPSQSVSYKGALISTNKNGFRDTEELKKKQTNEFRILSLGESSTLGVKVKDHETYSEMTEKLLQLKLKHKKIKVINAGVSAWSSWQSYQFLKEKGLKLQPDLILFYHELNDNLPSSLRNSSSSPLSVTLTDRELSLSLINRISRFLLNYSCFIRKVTLYLNKKNFLKYNNKNKNPLTEIGLPDTGLGARLRWKKTGEKIKKIDEKNLPPRVTEAEKIIIIRELIELCNKHNIDILFIHPAYRKTRQHSCVLTKTLKAMNVKYLDMINVFAAMNKNDLFIDAWHPSKKGHEIIASELVKFIIKNIFKEKNEIT